MWHFEGDPQSAVLHSKRMERCSGTRAVLHVFPRRVTPYEKLSVSAARRDSAAKAVDKCGALEEVEVLNAGSSARLCTARSVIRVVDRTGNTSGSSC